MIDATQYPDLQSAVNAMPADGYGGAVRLPGMLANDDGSWSRRAYVVNRPLLVQNQGARLVGEGKWQSTKIQASGYFGPGVVYMPRGFKIPLDDPLLPGPGHSFVLCRSPYQGYLDLRDADVLGIDGLTQFTLSFVFKPDRVDGYRWILGSDGRRTQADPWTTAVAVRLNDGGQLDVILTCGGTRHEWGTSAPTVQAGQGYWVGLVYTGSAINLYGGPVGGSATLLRSEAASGPINQQPTENWSVGPRHTYWPEEGINVDPVWGLIDCIHISKVVRHTGSSFPVPSAKPKADPNTLLLLNFDKFMGDGGVLTGDGGCFAVGDYSYWPPDATSPVGRSMPVYLPFRSVVYDRSLTHGWLEGMEVSANGPAVMALYCDQLTLADLYCHGSSVGIHLMHQCYEADLDRIKLDGDGFTMPGGRKAVRAGLLCGKTSSGWNLNKFDVQGYPYSVADSGCNGAVNHFFCTTEECTVAHLLLKGDGGASNTLDVRHLSIDDEGGAPPNGFKAALWLDNMIAAVLVGGKVEVTQNLNPAPAVLADGGTAVDFIGTSFNLGPNVYVVSDQSDGRPAPALGVQFAGCKLASTRNPQPQWVKGVS